MQQGQEEHITPELMNALLMKLRSIQCTHCSTKNMDGIPVEYKIRQFFFFKDSVDMPCLVSGFCLKGGEENSDRLMIKRSCPKDALKDMHKSVIGIVCAASDRVKEMTGLCTRVPGTVEDILPVLQFSEAGTHTLVLAISFERKPILLRPMEGYDVWRSLRLDSRELLYYALCQQAEEDYWDQSRNIHVALGTKAGKDVLDFRLRSMLIRITCPGCGNSRKQIMQWINTDFTNTGMDHTMLKMQAFRSVHKSLPEDILTMISRYLHSSSKGTGLQVNFGHWNNNRMDIRKVAYKAVYNI